MHARSAFALLVASAVLTAACGARTGLDASDQDAAKNDAAVDALGDAVIIDAHGDTPGTVDAADAGAGVLADLYVAASLFDTPTLFRFDPVKVTLTPIGPLHCATGSAWLLSMTTDRHGSMWFADSVGYLYRVERAGLTCNQEAYRPGQSGFDSVQIAWAADPTPSGNPMALFAITPSTNQLAKIDVASWGLTVVGALDQSLELPRLAGSDDGRLFGMAFTSPLVEIDRRTAHVTTIGDIPAVSGSGGGMGLVVRGDDVFVFRGTTAGLVRFAQYSLSGHDVVSSGDASIATGNVIIGAGVLDSGL